MIQRFSRLIAGIIVLAQAALLPGPGLCAQKSNESPERLLMPVTTLMQKLNQHEHIFLVDVRPARDFNRFKIPGAMNIPLSLIKTKSFLKAYPMVIIHPGFAHKNLAAAAQTLNRSGYKARVLLGGLAAWHHKNGKITGNPFAVRTINTLDPVQLFSGIGHEDWQVFSLSRDAALTALVPSAVTLKDPENLGRQLGKERFPETRAIILMDDTGQNLPQIIKELPAQYQLKTFALSGGLAAYKTFLTRHMLANRPKKARTIDTATCEPCKKRHDQ